MDYYIVAALLENKYDPRTMEPVEGVALGKLFYEGDSVEDADKAARVAAVKYPDNTYYVFKTFKEVRSDLEQITVSNYL